MAIDISMWDYIPQQGALLYKNDGGARRKF